MEQKRLIKGAPWWMILLALLGLVGFAVGMVSMPQEDVMQNSGLVLQVAGGLIVAFYFLRIVITAFKESVLQGILSIILPPILHGSRGGIAWRGCSFSWWLAGLASGSVSSWSIWHRCCKPKRKQSALRDLRERPAMVMVCHDTASI